MELDNLAVKYGTDKSPRIKHSYTLFYQKLFSPIRKKVKKVLELGVGCPATMKHVRHYHLGASLYMWREFFPNAQIYGVDINPEAIFCDERIRCFLGDELNPRDWDMILSHTGTDIDIFIDDGSHQKEHQITTAKYVLPKLKREVIYVIEDVEFPDKIKAALTDFDYTFVKSPLKYHDDNLMIVRCK